MGIRVYRPTSAGRRNSSVSDFAEITRDEPEKTWQEPPALPHLLSEPTAGLPEAAEA